MTLVVLATLALVASLPWWLPDLVVRLRMRIFTRVNGEEGLEIPGAVDASRFEWLYSRPAAAGRSRGARLSDLFWYWLAPGPEVHQEHLEPGPRYDDVAATTRRFLAVPRGEVEERTRRATQRILDERPVSRWRNVRLRDLWMPVWAELYYELVFGESCPAPVRKLVVDNANDVVTALKCCGLRHMDRRDRLTRYLHVRVAQGGLRHPLPRSLDARERVFYLQGTFFNTAVVQMSEALAHLLLALAHRPDLQDAILSEGPKGRTLDHVIAESLRLYPLFGISHRITTESIALDAETTLPVGSVLCFNHPAYHASACEDPERFHPARWESLSAREAHYIPFGVAANRPCPAQGIALITMRTAALTLLGRYRLHSSAAHTRSLPSRGPCLLVPRERPLPRGLRALLLFAMRARDHWENVPRSVVQLVLGTYMVWHARRLRLCERYFERDAGGPAAGGGERDASACPVHAREHTVH